MKGKKPSILVLCRGPDFSRSGRTVGGPREVREGLRGDPPFGNAYVCPCIPKKMDPTVLMRFRMGNAKATEISIVGKVWVFHRELRFCPNHRVKGKKPSILVLSRGPDPVGQVGQWEDPGRLGWVSEETHSLFWLYTC